jgi:hypothetical protein
MQKNPKNTVATPDATFTKKSVIQFCVAAAAIFMPWLSIITLPATDSKSIELRTDGYASCRRADPHAQIRARLTLKENGWGALCGFFFWSGGVSAAAAAASNVVN